MNTISCHEFVQRYRKDPSLLMIDVRSPAEFRARHIQGAHSLPLVSVSARCIRKLQSRPQQPVYLLCQSGGRALQAASKLLAQDAEMVTFVVEGGTEACEVDLPIDSHGGGVIAMERQVRIAAGVLVLLGALLGALIHPNFHWLSAVIGAGLLLSGLTNSCGMARVLAVMPWNK